jgi:CheY-like chemotaxis protein
MRANRIIIQDIDKDILHVIRYCLEELKFIVHSIQDSQDILTDISGFKPDLILLDYKLSGWDSITACRQIKRANPKLPVLAMSCNPEIKKIFKKHSFDAYIKKPFDIYHLFSILGKYCPRPINHKCFEKDCIDHRQS